MDVKERDTVISIGKINPKHLELELGQYFRYRGSLTTPPYIEGAEWIIIQDIAEASLGQIEVFRKAVLGSNARAVQPLNDRLVLSVQE